MSHLISIYFKLIILSLIGMTAVKIWVIFIVFWVHGGKYQWTWMDAKSILVNGLVLAAVFCAIATIIIYRKKNRS